MSTPWSRVDPDQYLALDLRAHDALAGFPLHDVWSVFLPGESRTCTMVEIRQVAHAARSTRSRPFSVRSLFAFRHVLGRLFGWDQPARRPDSERLRNRLPEADLAVSLVPPGTKDGPFEVVYVHTTEAVSEIENATVRAFLVWAVTPTPGGHNLFWAIYVVPNSAWTRWYMALIDPFRRWIVYPSLLDQLHKAWTAEANSDA